jgi:hypothetical protein
LQVKGFDRSLSQKAVQANKKELKYSQEAAKDINIQRGNNKITAYNPYADYNINIEGLPDIVNVSLSKSCREVAKIGSENNCEMLHLIDLDTGELSFFEKGANDEVGGKGFWNFISKNENKVKKFAFIHNHPTDGFLSATDMQTFIRNENILCMISTSNDGLKRIAYGNIKTKIKLTDLYKDEIEDLRKKARSGIIDAPDYTFEYEILLVENSIRDFANLGFWEVDGRV